MATRASRLLPPAVRAPVRDGTRRASVSNSTLCRRPANLPGGGHVKTRAPRCKRNRHAVPRRTGRCVALAIVAVAGRPPPPPWRGGSRAW
jgi:hypothetical protein